MRTNERGIALIDVVAALAVALTMTTLAVPVVGGTLDQEFTMIGARHLAGLLQRAKAESLMRSVSVAARFEVLDGRTRVRLYADGNGNGVRQRDIDRGIDWPVSGYEWLDAHSRDVSLRVNQTVTDLGAPGLLAPGADPLRIGHTALVSFSPVGSSSSGTIYLAARRGPQMAIRLYGASGRVSVVKFDARTRRWQP